MVALTTVAGDVIFLADGALAAIVSPFAVTDVIYAVGVSVDAVDLAIASIIEDAFVYVIAVAASSSA